MTIINTACVDLKIRENNVDVLKTDANDFIDQLERKSGNLGELGNLLLWSNRQRNYTLEEIDIALRKFLLKKYPDSKIETTISVIDFKAFGLGEADGCIVTIETAHAFGCLVLVDEKINKIKPDLKKKGQNSLVYAYNRAMKLIYLHEIGHVLLNHDNFSLAPRPAKGALKSFTAGHAKNDAQCDVLSYVLAFWPLVGKGGFKTLVQKVYDAWDKSDLRNSLANFYKMPINAVAQWIVIMLTDPYRTHYARLMMTAPSPGQIVDCFDCKDVVCSIMPEETRVAGLSEDEAAKQLFTLKNRDTSAKKVLNTPHCDHKMVHKELQLKCAAFFEDSKFAYNRPSDEIIVIGLAPQN